MTFEPYDVVVVPFPFTDRLASRRRPALIVSSESFHAEHGQSILAMITSTRAEWPSDVSIGRWQEAGLHVPCRIRFKLFTLDNSLILRRVGRLSERDRGATGEALTRILAS
ncbi:MAG: type II toxin-antitoxin system PemK/MazF family toxin [Gemmatimonadales bacterium]|nr:type II toxin-antitoxin system PemK/MazF family toxin [Gemmatimonadales bacterium]MYG19204.1 type II toxin-antitoxin system PemK/MazF family toxin [Gemmatimonadales bacterium]MYH10304.1 type II toxin-antitoxin system PemK/MazF family toxin [Gemmatimonadales bacterium]MYL05970.1 type II toxin-antitoxin system PemK/MazF family toxin [Gemmatimonadales bacterium]